LPVEMFPAVESAEGLDVVRDDDIYRRDVGCQC
jgi:hypothetical protein